MRKNQTKHTRHLIKRTRHQKRNFFVIVLSSIFFVFLFVFLGFFLTHFDYARQTEKMVSDFDSCYGTSSLYGREALYADSLCVSDRDSAEIDVVPFAGDDLFCEAYFDLEHANILYSSQIYKKIYPASTTKILTAIVAIKYGQMDDVVTISETASAGSFQSDEQVCGLRAGDQLTLYDLLCGLMLHSGNDAAVAVAEYIGGDYSSFIDMMNAEAASLFATKSHFVNPHGLHNDNHYTTPYDLYLLFNEFIRHPELVDIIAQKEYSAQITDSANTIRSVTWQATNLYSNGLYSPADGITVIGGKTGTTKEAGNCLVILEENQHENRFISIVMGSPSREDIYQRINYVSALFP